MFLEVSPNEWWGASVVKWPAVSTNGSKVYGKHKNTLTQFDCTIDCRLITFHGKPLLTVDFKCSICIDGSIGLYSKRRNTTCYDTADSGGPLVPRMKSSLGLITSNFFINSHRGHHTQSLAARNRPGNSLSIKSHAWRQLHIITVWKKCLGVCGGCQLNGHSALFSWDGPPKDNELDQTKTLLARFCLFFSHGV